VKNRRGNTGDPIIQPAWETGNDQYRIGELMKWNANQDLDCAIFSIDNRAVNATDSFNDLTGTHTQICIKT